MLLSLIFLTLVLGLLILSITPKSQLSYLRAIALSCSGLTLILSTFLLLEFNNNQYYFQTITLFKVGFDFLNLYLVLGLDGLSILFFVLSSFLIFLCILFIWEESNFKQYAFALIVLDLLLLLVFSVLDLLLFYIAFEAILIPMYLIIGVWGSRERKIRAVYLFFFYTLLGSLCLLIGLLYIYAVTGTLNLEHLLSLKFSFNEQYWLWLAFFFSFSSKIPMFPFHVWLPEAHVEAPTVGSVLLAGILLKLGVYGFLRFSLTLFPDASLFFSPLVYMLSILGIVYASLTAIRQTDLKRIIAYSSIAHMNLVTLGLFSFNVLGIEGSILQSVSHGFVSGAMFLLIGILYDRYHSRLLYYYSGLVHMMPVYSIFLLIFTMANIALPGTSSFIGEFLLLCGVYKVNTIICVLATLGVILCGGYSLWLYNRIIFGNLKVSNTLIFKDMSFREFSILIPLLTLVLFMGIAPNFFVNFINMASSTLFFLTAT
jgi:proton-translocating NADH-quinone oxidoreductase chain M